MCFRKGWKHYGKRRKCWLPAFSPFPLMFSKGFSYRVVKSQDCLVKIYYCFFFCKVLLKFFIKLKLKIILEMRALSYILYYFSLPLEDHYGLFNSLPNYKIFDRSKLKAFADDKINVTEKSKFVFGRVPAFSPFPVMFSKDFFLRVVKSRDCVVKG